MIAKNMWINYNPNPKGRRVGDCSVRAISAAFDLDWDSTYDLLCAKGKGLCDMPSGDAVWGEVLKDSGLARKAIPITYPSNYTARDFAEDHPNGIYVLGFGGHVVTIKDGFIFDSWDSSQEIPVYFWR